MAAERLEVDIRHSGEVAIPSQSQLILPLLEALDSEGGSAKASVVCDAIASRINLLPDEREACSRTPGGKKFNVLDRAVRWTHQLSKLRGLTTNSGPGTWTLTGAARNKLENASPGIVVLVYENNLGSLG